MKYEHQPALLKEVIANLNLKSGQVVIDGTLGGAGHAQEILKKISSSGFLLGFDLDPQAIETSKNRLSKIGDNFQLINDNFANLEKYEKQKVHGILLDLGISTNEIRNAGRGFSFQKLDEPLDLRMNPENPLTAETILNNYSEQEIRKIIKQYGEEPQAKQIARRVVTKRKIKKLKTVQDLLQIIEESYRGKPKPKKIHFATKTWQALRIEVNDEMNNLKAILEPALKILQPNGRLAVISFHSLEDRIVKQFFKQATRDCLCPSEFPVCKCDHQKQIKIITKKPIVPSQTEINNNPQARSAKLRVAEKIQN